MDDTNTPEVRSAFITLTKTGFSPKEIMISKGDAVTWVNESGSPMWVGSAMHPAHLVYGGTSKDEHCASGYKGPVPFDQCTSEDSYSFSFDKAGTWFYHNHMNSSQFGSVVVK